MTSSQYAPAGQRISGGRAEFRRLTFKRSRHVHSLSRLLCLLVFAGLGINSFADTNTVAQPDTLNTLEGTPIGFPALNLTTNDLPGSVNGTNTQLTVVS